MLMLAAVLLLATPDPCKDCKDAKATVVRSHPAPRKSVATKCEPAPSVLTTIKQGFAFTAGARWDEECPEFTTSEAGHHDPLFIGVEERIPLGYKTTLFGNYDRDIRDNGEWVQRAGWSARVGLSYSPWGK